MIGRTARTSLKIWAIILFAVVIVGYAGFQARNLVAGPQINVISPTDGSNLSDPLVVVKGTARNVSYISLNDRQIYVDRDGIFTEKLLLEPGYNIWKIEAKDKFGRIVSKRIELVYTKT